MNKQDQQALDELNAYIASRTEKTNKQNDNLIIANTNPEKIERLRKNTKAQFSTVEARKKLSESAKKRSMDPEHLLNREKGKEKIKNNLELKAKRIARNKAMASNPDLVARRSKATSLANSRCIKTPFGVFLSKKNAIQFAFENKLTPRSTLGSIRVYLSQCLKDDCKNYYYITKEEYIRLTGVNPWA
jgi:hypothetical protein